MEDFKQRVQVGLVVAGVAAFLFFFRLGGTRLWDRDEPRNAQCAWEMLQRNDWVVPTFNGELRGHKPVLLYWLMMVAYSWMGKTEFAARFWCALLSVGTCVLTADLVGKATRPSTGFWAGTILATSLLFVVSARAATPDAVLMFFTTAALWWLAGNVVPQTGSSNPTTRGDGWQAAASRPPQVDGNELGASEPALPACHYATKLWLLPAGAKRPFADHARCVVAPEGNRLEANRMGSPVAYGTLVVFYTLLALAVLAKGPVGLVLPAAIAGAYLLWDRCDVVSRGAACLGWSRKFAAWLKGLATAVIQLRPVTGLAVVLVLAGPWYAWVGWRTEGRFLYEFFVEHNLNRARSAMEGHSGPWWYYIPAILVGIFPWSIFFMPTVLETYYALRGGACYRKITRFLLAWLVVWVSAFSMAQTKLPSYVTPAYPALAGLTAIYLDRWRSKEGRIHDKWIPLALAVLGIVGGMVVVAGLLFIASYLPGERVLAATGIIPLLTALAAAWMYYRDRRALVSVTVLLGAMFFCLSLFSWAGPRIDRHRRFDRLLSKVVERNATAELGVVDVLEPSWVFYFGKPIKYFSTTFVHSAEPSENPIETFLRDHTNRFVITTRTVWETHYSRLSPDIGVLETVPYFLEEEELVLIGKSRMDVARSSGAALETARPSRARQSF